MSHTLTIWREGTLSVMIGCDTTPASGPIGGRAMKVNVRSFWRKDPVLFLSGLLALLSLLWVPPDRAYAGYLDFKVLICLFVLMLAVELLREAGWLDVAAQHVLRQAGSRRKLSVLLTAFAFFLSMLVTNDVALLTLVPLTLRITGDGHDAPLTVRLLVLQTLAANIGSMLTPVGNPQNLYLYAHGSMTWPVFWGAVWPVGLAGGLLLGLLALLGPDRPLPQGPHPPKLSPGAAPLAGLILFAAAVLCVFGVLPAWLLLAGALLIVLPLRPASLARVDYALLLTFAFFFVFVGNVSRIDAVARWLGGMLASPAQVILTGSLASQVISNVPAAILLSGFTTRWAELLRGVNVGGCGTLVASLASLITWRLYSRTASASCERRRFLLVFSGLNALFLAVLLAVALLAPF